MLLRRREVLYLTSLSQSSLYRLMNESRFPGPVRMFTLPSGATDIVTLGPDLFVRMNTRNPNEVRFSHPPLLIAD